MSADEVEQRFLLIARERLKNRPLALQQLEAELSSPHKVGYLRFLQLSLTDYQVAMAFGHFERLDAELLKMVDEWAQRYAEKNPEPTIAPLPPQCSNPQKEFRGYVSEYVNPEIPKLESAGVAVLIGGDFPEKPRPATPAEMEQLELIWQKAGCGPFDGRASHAERKQYADAAKAEGVEIQFVHAGIRTGVELEREQKAPTFGVLQMQPPKGADYLATLHQWNALPEIVPVPDLAELFAALCKQNKAALMKIMESAIWAGDIQFWGLSHSGPWIKDMVRVWASSKPRYTLPTEQQGLKVSVHVKNEITEGVDRLHLEAMGVRPVDFVSLLEKRGRKVPDELKVFLPEKTEPQQSAPASASRSAAQDAESIIPGKLPNVSVGKLAIKAAWKIEREGRRAATAPEVMSLLQGWADDGVHPETLRKSQKNSQGVEWATGKGKPKIYDVDACGKTLAAWRKSRA